MSRIFLSPPHMSGHELEYVKDAFASNWIAPLGPHVDAFEREVCSYTGMTAATALVSGTSALHLALVMLGVGRGDRVMCSDLTFAASANAITYVGAEPVFIDADAQSWNLDPELLEEELARCNRENRLPKALIVVDLYGQCAAYKRILPICERYGVPVIEDAAEALGARYDGKAAGQFGEMAALSFNGNKIITSSGGGMLLSKHEEYCKKALFLATQARDPAPHYEHSQIGYNYRMSNVVAAIGRGQMRVLSERVQRKREIRERYRKHLAALPGLTFMPLDPDGEDNAWLTCILLDPKAFGADRETVRLSLEEQNVESRPLWKPMHMQAVFASCRTVGGSVGEALFEQGLCLPSGTAMTDEQLAQVAQHVKACAAP